MRGLLALWLTFGFNFGTGVTVNFDSARPGTIPPGWSVTHSGVPAHWQITADKTAPSRPFVLAQTSTHSGRHDYSIALFDRSTCMDGAVSVDLKMMSGKMEQSAGVIWRFQNNANFYFALASADKDTVSIYKRVNNQVSLVAPAVVPHRIDDSEWNLLRVTFRGPKFTLYFGHRKLVEANDGAITSTGKMGVWTKADTVAHFDNFRVGKAQLTGAWGCACKRCSPDW